MAPAATHVLMTDDLAIDISELPAPGSMLTFEIPEQVAVDLIGLVDADDPAGRAYQVWISAWGESELVGAGWHFVKASGRITGPFTATRTFNRSMRWATAASRAALQRYIAQAQAQLLASPDEVIG